MALVTIHQPDHAPWLGFFDKTRRADVVVLLDDVQFKKNNFQNRNRIRTGADWAWLTVPVYTKGRFGQSILDVAPREESRWREVYFRTLFQNYRGAPYWDRYASIFSALLEKSWDRLVDLNLEWIRLLWEAFGISPRVVRSSELGIRETGTRRLVEICRSQGASEYLSGAGGRDYLDESLFREAGMRVRFQDFRHPTYRQCLDPFVPGLSAVDLLLNEGPRSLEILAAANPARVPAEAGVRAGGS